MANSNEQKKLFVLVTTAMLAAIVFVSNYITIPIPVAIGDVTRIHLANGICILSGLLVGPIGGGLAAGIGSALFDLLNPVYAPSALFTFAFKFILAFIPGLLMQKSKTHKLVMGLIGASLGQIAYIILYLSKSFFQGLLEGSAPQALIPAMVTKLGTSAINAVLAIIIANLLYNVLKNALDRTNLSKHFN